VGVHFGRMTPAMVTMLEDLLTLKALPQPPWIARLAFGAEAVAKMKELSEAREPAALP
jgi:hypothetical protein